MDSNGTTDAEKAFKQQPDLCVEWQGELATKACRIGKVTVSSANRVVTKLEVKPKLKDIVTDKIVLLQLPIATVLSSVLEKKTDLHWTHPTGLSEEGQVRLLYIRSDKADAERWQKAMEKLSGKEIVPFCKIGEKQYFLVLSLPLLQKYFSSCLLGNFNDNRMAYGLLVTGKHVEFTVKTGAPTKVTPPAVIKQTSEGDVNGNTKDQTCATKQVMRSISQPANTETVKEIPLLPQRRASIESTDLQPKVLTDPQQSSTDLQFPSEVTADSHGKILSPAAGPQGWSLQRISTKSPEPVAPPTDLPSTVSSTNQDQDYRVLYPKPHFYGTASNKPAETITKETAVSSSNETRLANISQYVDEQLKEIRGHQTYADPPFETDTDLRRENAPKQYEEDFTQMISKSGEKKDYHRYETQDDRASLPEDGVSSEGPRYRNRYPIDLETSPTWTDKKHAIVRPSNIQNRRRSSLESQELVASEVEAAVTSIHKQDKKSKEKMTEEDLDDYYRKQAEEEDEDLRNKDEDLRTRGLDAKDVETKWNDFVLKKQDMDEFKSIKDKVLAKWSELEHLHKHAPFVRNTLPSIVFKIKQLRKEIQDQIRCQDRSPRSVDTYMYNMYVELGREITCLHSAACTATNLKDRCALETTEKWVDHVDVPFMHRILKSCNIMDKGRHNCPKAHLDIYDHISDDVHKFKDYLVVYEEERAKSPPKFGSPRMRDSLSPERPSPSWRKRSRTPEFERRRHEGSYRKRSREARGRRHSRRSRSRSRSPSWGSPRRRSSVGRKERSRDEDRRERSRDGDRSERTPGKRARSHSRSPEAKRRRGSHSREEKTGRKTPKVKSTVRKLITEISESDDLSSSDTDVRPKKVTGEKGERTYRKSHVDSDDSVESGEFEEDNVVVSKKKKSSGTRRKLLGPETTHSKKKKHKDVKSVFETVETESQDKKGSKISSSLSKIKLLGKAKLGAKFKGLSCISKGTVSPDKGHTDKENDIKEHNVTELLDVPEKNKVDLAQQLIDKVNQRKSQKQALKLQLKEQSQKAVEKAKKEELLKKTEKSDLSFEMPNSPDLSDNEPAYFSIQKSDSEENDESEDKKDDSSEMNISKEGDAPSIDIQMLQEVVNTPTSTEAASSKTDFVEDDLYTKVIANDLKVTQTSKPPQPASSAVGSPQYNQGSYYGAPNAPWQTSSPWTTSGWSGYTSSTQYPQQYDSRHTAYWSKFSFPQQPTSGSSLAKSAEAETTIEERAAEQFEQPSTSGTSNSGRHLVELTAGKKAKGKKRKKRRS